MIKVTIGNNVDRKPVILDENTTLRAALEEQGIDYSVGMTSLDGYPRPRRFGQDFCRFRLYRRRGTQQVLPFECCQDRQRCVSNT